MYNSWIETQLFCPIARKKASMFSCLSVVFFPCKSEIVVLKKFAGIFLLIYKAKFIKMR